MITKLTGVQYGRLKDVEDTICPGNHAIVRHVSDKDNEHGPAYAVECKGVNIGWLPLLNTLKGYWRDAGSMEAQQRVQEWGTATKKVRQWLDSRVKYEFEGEWNVRIAEILYQKSDGTWTPDDLEGGEHLKPKQISVDFVEVEAF